MWAPGEFDHDVVESFTVCGDTVRFDRSASILPPTGSPVAMCAADRKNRAPFHVVVLPDLRVHMVFCSGSLFV
jgi:hypothetical protein